jgi:hypothetical protein
LINLFISKLDVLNLIPKISIKSHGLILSLSIFPNPKLINLNHCLPALLSKEGKINPLNWIKADCSSKIKSSSRKKILQKMAISSIKNAIISLPL